MISDDEARALIAQTASVLERLAAPAEEQVAYLQNLGVGDCADELALELDDVARVLPALASRGFITPCDA
jgi:hypothetical protein